MPIERAAGGSNLIDVLDRVLDKGIIVDAWMLVSLIGADRIIDDVPVPPDDGGPHGPQSGGAAALPPPGRSG